MRATSKNECRGPESCSEIVTIGTSTIYAEETETVVEGEVIPFRSYFMGDPIPSHMLLVRFKSVQEEFRDTLRAKYAPWRKKHISRVALLDGFGNVVGSAKRSCYTFLNDEDHDDGSPSDFEISKAAIICDVRIDEGHRADDYVHRSTSPR